MCYKQHGCTIQQSKTPLSTQKLGGKGKKSTELSELKDLLRRFNDDGK